MDLLPDMGGFKVDLLPDLGGASLAPPPLATGLLATPKFVSLSKLRMSNSPSNMSVFNTHLKITDVSLELVSYRNSTSTLTTCNISLINSVFDRENLI